MPVFFFCLARFVRQQQLQHSYLTRRQRDCQRRRSVKCTLVHVCAMLEQQQHALSVSPAGRKHQRRLPMRLGRLVCVGIGGK